MSIIKGFHELRIMDCRFSSLGNMFLKNLSKKPKIREIYFQHYLTTYFPEKHRRELEISSGSRRLKHSYIKDHDDIPLWNENVLRSYFGSNVNTNEMYNHCNSLSDRSTERYTHSNYIEDNYHFESVLYKRPYNECTCEYNSTTGLAVANVKSEINHDDRMDQYVCKDDILYTLDPACFTHELENANKSEKDIAIEELIDPSYCRRTRRRVQAWCGYAKVRKHMATSIREDEYFSNYNNVSLTKISLRGCNSITDATLQHLTHLHLLLLDVTGTNVTTEGLIKFAIDNVQCRIIHETMCTCLPTLHF
nr:uncharacterized protein LOC111429404 isoform X1 [Onthophagus taurus]